MTPEDPYVTIKRLMHALLQQKKDFDDLTVVNQQQRKVIGELREVVSQWQSAFEQAKGRMQLMGDTFIATLERLKLRSEELQ